MEASAKLSDLKSSAQKVRLVADLIRGRGVDDALQVLRTTPKAVSKDLELLVRSAVANAENRNPGVDVDELFVSKIWVDGARSEKRIRPAPMGRALPILKRRSHVTIVVAERPASEKKAEAKPGARKGAAKKPTAEGPAPRANK